MPGATLHHRRPPWDPLRGQSADWSGVKVTAEAASQLQLYLPSSLQSLQLSGLLAGLQYNNVIKIANVFQGKHFLICCMSWRKGIVKQN